MSRKDVITEQRHQDGLRYTNVKNQVDKDFHDDNLRHTFCELSARMFSLFLVDIPKLAVWSAATDIRGKVSEAQNMRFDESKEDVSIVITSLSASLQRLQWDIAEKLAFCNKQLKKL